MGRCFFCNKKNPSPEPAEGNLFTKICRHFDRLSDRVAADEFVRKEASALESPLDATLRGRDHVAVHVVCLAKVCHPTSVTLNLIHGL